MIESMRDLPIEKVQCRRQVRVTVEDDALAGLVASAQQIGLQQPIRVRREGELYVVVDGHRRLAACKRAGMTTIPAIVETTELDEGGIIQRQLIANCQRMDLAPLEKARGIDELMRLAGCTAAETAIKLGMSASSVTRLLALLTMPEQVQAAIDAGTISASAAYELSQMSEPAKAELAERLLKGELTRDGIAGLKKAAKQPEARGSAAAKPVRRVIARLDAHRSITFTGEGLSTLEELTLWLETLLAKVRKARPQGLSLGTFVKTLKDQASSETPSCR